MSESLYRDLLWDFVYEGSGEQSLVKLRIYSNEAEMFDSNKSAAEIPVTLPLSWLSDSELTWTDWTHSRLPSTLLRKVGHDLWTALPDSAKQPLLEAIPERPCRLKISSNLPMVDDLPWEWLNDGAGPPLALRPEIRLARSVPIRVAIPPLMVKPPVKVLLVISNPKEAYLLNPGPEIEAVANRLHAPDYELRVLEDTTWTALQEALKDELHIIHYIGHAGLDRGAGNLILLDARKISHWITGPELAQALPLTVQLLCLSTCFTAPNYQIMGLPRLAHVAGTYRLPTVVTNCYPVGPDSVSTFWTNFYSTLMENGNANEAFHRAQAEVAAINSNSADWGSFSLVIRDQSGEVLHLGTPESGWLNEVSKGVQDRLDIQVQMASRLANDLAASLATFGSDASESLQKHVNTAITKAYDLAKKLRGGEKL